jgi:hypothetical protein
MGQRKRLSGLGIPTVDEDQGRQLVHNGEAAKIGHIQGAVSVAPDIPGPHHPDAHILAPVEQMAEVLFPRSQGQRMKPSKS